MTFDAYARILTERLKFAFTWGIPVLSQDPNQGPSAEKFQQAIAFFESEIDKLSALSENVHGAQQAIDACKEYFLLLKEFPLDLLAQMEKAQLEANAAAPHIIKTEHSVAKRFCPWNDWTVDENGPRYTDTGDPQWIIDKTTNTPYLNEPKYLIRLKCFALIFGTVIQIIAALLKGILFLAIFATGLFANDAICRTLWPDSPDDLAANFAKSFLKIFAIPLYSTALAVTAVYGLFNPYDARKIYSGLESAYFDEWRLAPCFQSEASSHFFGSRIDQQGGF